MKLIIQFFLHFLTYSTGVHAFFSYKTFAQKQQPLPPQDCSSDQLLAAFPAFSPLIGRCPTTTHWECHYRGKIHCGCFPNRRSTVITAEITSRAQAQAENVTALEVLAEVQPGNNNTLVSLFQLNCDEGMHAGCELAPGHFECGCLQNRCTSDTKKTDIDMEALDQSALGENQEHQSSSGGDEEELVSDSATREASDFRFQRIRYPICHKIGYHIQCCSVQRKSRCYCVWSGYHCPRN